MPRTPLLAALVSATSAALLLLGGATPAASAAGRWAPPGKAAIRPGVQMFTEGAQCTGNSVFTNADRRVYVGYSAHCAGTGAATDTNGCVAKSHPLGTRVRFAEGASLVSGGDTVGRGRLVYSSWVTMQRRGTKNANACAHNDFALVRVGRDHVGKVNPTVPFWGGPTGVDTNGSLPGDEVYSYGNTSLRAGITELSPKVGTSVGSTAGDWTHPVYTLTPGVPGDSGSGFLDAQGRALGTLSTLAVAPLPASNGVGDLDHELRYAQRHSGIDGLRLVKGTVGFSGIL
jgi:hypothetical protein